MHFNMILGYNAACQLTGDVSRQEASAIYKKLLDPKSEILMLFVTPEKISKSKMLMSRLEKAHVQGRLQRMSI